jgi:peptide/nickel transport system substrate-binding protein
MKPVDDLLQQRLSRAQLLRAAAVLGIAGPASASLARGAAAQGWAAAAVRPAVSRFQGGKSSITVAMPDTPPGLDDDQLLNALTEKVAVNCYSHDMVGFKVKNDSEFGGQMADILAPGSEGIDPGFAESWQVSADGRTYTFKLRDDVGSPWGNKLTAEDVKWSFDRRKALKGVGGFMTDVMLVKSPDDVKVVDPQTVSITISAPNPAFFKIDAIMWYGGVFDSQEAKKHATGDDPWATQWLATNTAGFGPYHVQDLVQGQGLRLVANPNWYKGKPPIEQIVWRAIPSAADRLALLSRGDVDIAEGLTGEQLKGLAGTGDVQVISRPSNIIRSLILNMQKPELKDVRVRQAIAYAVPYDQIIQSVFFGEADRQRSPVPAMYPGYTDKYWVYDTNVEKAKSLLKEAGSQPFKLPVTFDSSSAEDQLIANILQTALGEIGIEVVQDKVPTAVFSQKIGKKQDYAYLAQNWPLVADSGYALWVYWFSTNFLNAANYNNPEFDSLLTSGMGTLDETQRTEAFRKAQEIYERDQPWVILVNQRFQLPMSRKLSGFVWYTDNHVHYEHLTAAG